MGRRRRRWSDDSGASSVELVFYAPLLALIVFVVVQAGLVYLGYQASTSVAREASRAARTAGSTSDADLRAAERAGEDYAAAVASAYLTEVDVQVVAIDGGEGVRTTVEAESYALIPALGGHITRVVEGPVEEFRQDDRGPG